ncbi:Phosphoadenosine phosphosulfate reductase [Thalassocella blandensis]|nr:Phosphoadenosine phosphosulfate reductase [Thalassocella blandensis]
MPLSLRKLQQLNTEMKSSTPESIINCALEMNEPTVATTNFGPHEAAILHRIAIQAPDLPIIWIDHGYNTKATYIFAEDIIQRLHLNIKVYTPLITSNRREYALGGIPAIENEQAHSAFTRQVKLEPFSRAFNDFKPAIWLTALRKEQTAHRASLDIFTLDTSFNCLKVAPFYHWSELDMEEYLVNHNLPIVEDYFDPTKVLKDRECGLHISA